MLAIVPLEESELSLSELPFIFGNSRNLKVTQHGNLLNSEIDKYRNPGTYLSEGCRAALNKSLVQCFKLGKNKKPYSASRITEKQFTAQLNIYFCQHSNPILHLVSYDDQTTKPICL